MTYSSTLFSLLGSIIKYSICIPHDLLTKNWQHANKKTYAFILQFPIHQNQRQWVPINNTLSNLISFCFWIPHPA